jgi:Entner-Doudoroff aldolase
MNIDAIMRTAPVIPVIVIEDVAHAVPLAEALVAGGLRVLEVTLRTPAALASITAMKQVEGAIVGAGTVTNPKELDAALAAGSEFIVSPGLTEPLGKAAIASGAVDAVVFGKAFLSNPDLVERFRAGAELNPVDFGKLYTPGPAGYTDYPAMAA